MAKLIKIGFLILLLPACATSYQKNGFTGGYSETQLDENVFRVSFRGNGYTGRERVADFTLLRSAELALENSYNYFAIIDANSATSHSTFTTPSSSYTTGSAYSSGNYVYGSARTTTYGGQTYLISKPSASNTIVCFKKKPDNLFTYNAKFIDKNIREKYGISGPKKVEADPEVDKKRSCVKAYARVGDTFFAPDGTPLVIKTLIGKSTECHNPELPIKAVLLSPEEYVESQPRIKGSGQLK